MRLGHSSVARALESNTGWKYRERLDAKLVHVKPVVALVNSAVVYVGMIHAFVESRNN